MINIKNAIRHGVRKGLQITTDIVFLADLGILVYGLATLGNLVRLFFFASFSRFARIYTVGDYGPL